MIDDKIMSYLTLSCFYFFLLLKTSELKSRSWWYANNIWTMIIDNGNENKRKIKKLMYFRSATDLFTGGDSRPSSNDGVWKLFSRFC